MLGEFFSPAFLSIKCNSHKFLCTTSYKKKSNTVGNTPFPPQDSSKVTPRPSEWVLVASANKGSWGGQIAQDLSLRRIGKILQHFRRAHILLKSSKLELFPWFFFGMLPFLLPSDPVLRWWPSYTTALVWLQCIGGSKHERELRQILCSFIFLFFPKLGSMFT